MIIQCKSQTKLFIDNIQKMVISVWRCYEYFFLHHSCVLEWICICLKDSLHRVILTSKGYTTLVSCNSYGPFLCDTVLNTCCIFSSRCYHSMMFKRTSLHKFCKVYKGPFIRDAVLCYSLQWVWMYTSVFAGKQNVFQRCVNS